MADSKEWIVVFYVDENGGDPVREFMRSLDTKTLARFVWSIEQLRLRNVRAQQPLVRHVEGKLWEMREESNTNIYRILYFFFSDRRIVLLHGFQKKTQKTPRHEIEIALQRLDRFIKRAKGER